MSRKILLLACIAFVVHAPRSFPQESSNLFVNPEFDIGKAGWAVKAYGSAKATIEVVATAPLSGQNALVVHCTAGGSGLNVIHLYQSKTLQTGRIYTIRFMAVADVPHTIRIAFDEPSGESNTVWETPDIAVGTCRPLRPLHVPDADSRRHLQVQVHARRKGQRERDGRFRVTDLD